MHKQHPKKKEKEGKIQSVIIIRKEAVKCAVLGMRTFTKNSSKEDMTDGAMTSSSELFMGRALGETSVLFCPYGNINGDCECNFLEGTVPLHTA